MHLATHEQHVAQLDSTREALRFLAQPRERRNELLRTPQGTYFIVDEDEDDGTSITALHAHDAYELYLGLPYHMVDEDEAFEDAEAEAEAVPAE